jgi:hypothetical protein
MPEMSTIQNFKKRLSHFAATSEMTDGGLG